MCLAVPAKVLEIKGDRGVVDFGGIRREVNLSLIDNVKVGDYVLIHVGFAIQKLERKEAEEILKLWREVSEAINT
ncbi:MAG: HypC/HybG/HupF family hydrogenase formation chaperone [Candidatus Baldrarchaeota archaeon]|nr:HypC/HybG/HupF family hydrogenase formation chaperone [Candidatus Baldrarchaeota archaeon]